MKNWSIKMKIIFWYTLFFAVLIIFDFYFLRTSASQILTDQASVDVKNATVEIADSIKIEDDGIYIEEDEDDEQFSFYHDGVAFLVYENNNIAFGDSPDTFDGATPIQINEFQSIESNSMNWLVYDMAIEDGYVLRGIYDMNPMMNSISQVIMIAGILSPIIILFATIGGYIIIKRSFAPIKNIYKTASIIKEQEDYSKRIETSSAKDEVYELADMVNQMLDRVEQSMNREKQFSSNVSHELRTPLTVMQAQAEYMLKKAENSSQKADIKTIIQQISFMENVVTQLLEITRTRQLSKDDMESISLYEMIAFTSDSFSKSLKEKNIKLNIDKPSFETFVLCNQTMMIRVFSNLITNAIKYNQDHGEIHIKFEIESHKLVTYITDSGIGISKENLPKIFDAFYQTEESRTQNEFSFGLGLALVKEVIKIHGGDIQVNSIESQGTTFKIYLPLDKEKA
ncbi:sensor histidine kinase [Mariniplasma anaerobium]|uniref:histidine kinase n=1 Tax=Mariniplasma anaerobium TaxID=2735436 RepID=A0A7U9TID2_9MOLU|nr:HAMP domain-containing sensor histidine kinase [Mariniplasma anaerobium]BCR35759.1 two-component sensor histidine kinase [Mariniplasma anaerobium]